MSDSNDGRPGPDDPLPPELDPRRGRSKRTRRTSESAPEPVAATNGGVALWAGRGAKVLAATLSVVVLVGSGVLWGWYRDIDAKVTYVAGAIPGEKKDPDKPGRGQVPDVDGESQNILLVGDDSRAGLTEEQLKEVGTEADAGYNTDTILLVHIPANGEAASLVSFPRDSWVYIPVIDDEGKINSAYVNGMCASDFDNCNPDPSDPDQRRDGMYSLTETVSQVAGVKIDHYVQIGLWGFYNMTKALDGVEVCLKEPQKEPLSGIDLQAGRQTIEGKQAMAFVRQRHGLPHGDIDRIKRQQAFLGAIADKVISAEWLLKPWKLNSFFAEAAKSLTVDENLDLRDLAAQMRGIAAGDIEFTTVPVADEDYPTDKGSAVLLDEAKLPAFFAKFMGKDEPDEDKLESKPKPTVDRDQVQVAVYNGSGASGVAGQTEDALNAAGFTVTEVGDAASFDHVESEIHYAAGAEAQANTLAKVIPGAKLLADDSVGSGVQLILGSEFDGVQEGGTTEETPDPADAPKTEVRTADDDSCIY